MKSMVKKWSDLAVLSTEYSLMIYIFLNPNWKETHYVFCGRISEKQIKKMKMLGVKHVLAGESWLKINNKIKKTDISLVKRYWYKLRKEVFRIGMQVKVLKFFLVHHNNIRTFAQTDNSISQICHRYNFNLVEDGVFNYEPSKNKTGGGELVSLSYSTFVKRIYLTGRLPIPKLIANKVVLVNMSNCWENFKQNEKEEIIQLFGFNYHKLLDLIKTGRDEILLTQNFYRYGRCTTEEQIQIYREILSKHEMQKVIIKPHPEDEIAYENIFPQCFVLRDRFPFELCYFTKLPFKKLIAVNSTSIYGLWPDEYIESHEEMLTRLKNFS